MRDAIILALKREAEDGEGVLTKKLHLIAGRLVEKALAGDIQAIKEINDRVDGKAGGEGAGEAEPVNLKRIERVIVYPDGGPETKDTGGL